MRSFAALTVVDHIEAATGLAREMVADGAFTPQALRQVDEGVSALRTELRFARAMGGMMDSTPRMDGVDEHDPNDERPKDEDVIVVDEMPPHCVHIVQDDDGREVDRWPRFRLREKE